MSVLSLVLNKTHCLLNGVIDVSLGFIVLPLVHALCRRWAGSELALLKGHCIEFKYYADGIHSDLTPPG